MSFRLDGGLDCCAVGGGKTMDLDLEKRGVLLHCVLLPYGYFS